MILTDSRLQDLIQFAEGETSHLRDQVDACINRFELTTKRGKVLRIAVPLVVLIIAFFSFNYVSSFSFKPKTITVVVCFILFLFAAHFYYILSYGPIRKGIARINESITRIREWAHTNQIPEIEDSGVRAAYLGVVQMVEYANECVQYLEVEMG